jgi:hypothetical protein
MEKGSHELAGASGIRINNKPLHLLLKGGVKPRIGVKDQLLQKKAIYF